MPGTGSLDSRRSVDGDDATSPAEQEEDSELEEGTHAARVEISQELLSISDLVSQIDTFLKLRKQVLDSEIRIPAFEKTFEIMSEDPTNLEVLLNEIMNCSLKFDKQEQYEAFMKLWKEGSVGNQYFTATTNMVMHYRVRGEDYDQVLLNSKLRKILSVFNKEFSNWHARFTKLVESNQELGTKTGWNPSYDL